MQAAALLRHRSLPERREQQEQQRPSLLQPLLLLSSSSWQRCLLYVTTGCHRYPAARARSACASPPAPPLRAACWPEGPGGDGRGYGQPESHSSRGRRAPNDKQPCAAALASQPSGEALTMKYLSCTTTGLVCLRISAASDAVRDSSSQRRSGRMPAASCKRCGGAARGSRGEGRVPVAGAVAGWTRGGASNGSRQLGPVLLRRLLERWQGLLLTSPLV